MLEREMMAAALTVPRLVSDYSAWVSHIPFAFALMTVLRPRTLVELGTHKGDSYCAFCQGVELLGLQVRCVAVDTWAGDVNAGFYDASVLENLRAHHDPLYGRFSTLRQDTFDDAAKAFEAGSVDLLHIDGSHEYAAVRHDFELWQPRLSARGVVLLHDTRVFKEGFGVHRLWEELRGEHPHFEFHHGYGLGVLAVGKDLPPGFDKFLKAANGAPEFPRNLFAALGQRIELSRAVGLMTREVRLQVETANRWRGEVGAPQLPSVEAAGRGVEALSPPKDDLKAWLDRLGWFSANVSGDFAHCVAATTAARTREREPGGGRMP